MEYSLDGTNWTRYDAPVAFTTRGTFTVRYRATDRENNTSAVQQVAFSVVAGESCVPALSDEFGGTLDTSRWSYRHPTTPTGTRAPSVPTASCSCRSAPSRWTWRAPGRRRSWPSRCPRATSRW